MYLELYKLNMFSHWFYYNCYLFIFYLFNDMPQYRYCKYLNIQIKYDYKIAPEKQIIQKITAYKYKCL